MDLVAEENELAGLLVEGLRVAVPALCEQFLEQRLYAVSVFANSGFDGFGVVGNTVEAVDKATDRSDSPRGYFQQNAAQWVAYGDFNLLEAACSKVDALNPLTWESGLTLRPPI